MRRTFVLGGAEFSAPDPLGAGVFARFAQEQASLIDEKKVTLTSEEQKFCRELSAKDFKAAQKTGRAPVPFENIAAQKLTEKVSTKYPYEFILCTLRSILRPESGVSVEDGYESADDSEVEQVMLFFGESASVKMQSASSNPAHSQSSKRTPKPKA